MRPNDLKKGYYKLYDDAPTKADKAREAGLAKELSKKDKKPVVKATVVKASVKPLSAKQREAGMIEELSKEDFYGQEVPKDLRERAMRDAKEAINQRIVEKAMGAIFRRAPKK